MRKAKNRRKHARLAGEGMVTYRWSVPRRDQLLKVMSGEGQLQNVSGGGVCLVTAERLAPKRLLAITVPLAASELAIPTLAYVQWTRPLRGTGRYAAGLSFVI